MELIKFNVMQSHDFFISVCYRGNNFYNLYYHGYLQASSICLIFIESKPEHFNIGITEVIQWHILLIYFM